MAVASPDDSGQGARRMGPAVESMCRLVLWLVPTVEKFPRRQKFLLGDRLQATALDVLERRALRLAAITAPVSTAHREMPIRAARTARTRARPPRSGCRFDQALLDTLLDNVGRGR